MNLRDTLQRGWITVGVPGTEHDENGTYVVYPADALPELPPALTEGDGLAWLRDLAPVDDGMTPSEWDYATTPLTGEGLAHLLTGAGLGADRLPADLRALADPTVHARLFSATDSYVDAGEHLVPVPGGQLVHLVSDSQWVLHWFAFLGEDGSSGVVCTADPLGYEAFDGEAPAEWDTEQAMWVADSVAEFVWRWWADNYAFTIANPDLTPSLPAPDWFDLAAYTASYTVSSIVLT